MKLVQDRTVEGIPGGRPVTAAAISARQQILAVGGRWLRQLRQQDRAGAGGRAWVERAEMNFADRTVAVKAAAPAVSS